MEIQKSKIKMQNYNPKLKILLRVLFIYLTLNFLFSTFNLEKAEASALSLSIDPPIIEINAISPSDTTNSLTIKNNSDNQVVLQIQIKPFKVKGENAEPEYLSSEDFPILKNIQILDNKVPIEDITLGPSQEKKLTLSINLPEEINQIDYYFSIIFVSQNTSIPLSTSSLNQLGIASNILLSVGKKEIPSAILEEFSSDIFHEKGPVPFTIRLKNKGDHFIKPKGQIIIKNMFGQSIGRLDLPSVNILSGSTRVIPSALWKEDFLLGQYTATLSISLSDDGPIITKSIRFFSFPFGTAMMITAIAILLVIIGKKVEYWYNNRLN